jgi:peroxiredoxin Q/BCP
MSKQHALLNQPAPTFSLPNTDGTTYEFKPGATGKPAAVFFYPKADTFGCTREVCGFRDAMTEHVDFKDSGITIVGISGDPVPAIKTFAEKYNVTYPMLSDESGEARKAYSVSRGLMGMSEGRVTFFVDSEGVVRDVFDSVINYNGHVKAVTKALAESRKKGASADAPQAEGTTNA